MAGPSEGNLGGANFEIGANVDPLKKSLADAEKASHAAAENISKDAAKVGQAWHGAGGAGVKPPAGGSPGSTVAGAAAAAGGGAAATAASAAGGTSGVASGVVGGLAGVGLLAIVEKLIQALPKLIALESELYSAQDRVAKSNASFSGSIFKDSERLDDYKGKIEALKTRISELQYLVAHANSFIGEADYTIRLKRNLEELTIQQNLYAEAFVKSGEAQRTKIAEAKEFTGYLKEQLSLVKQIQAAQQQTYGIDKAVFGPGNQSEIAGILRDILGRIQ